MPRTKKASLGKIPRPPNCFIMYRSDVIKVIRSRQSPRFRQSSLSKIVSFMWDLEPPETHEKYKELAKEAKAEHKRVYPDWEFKPKKPKGSEPEDEDDSIWQKIVELERSRAQAARSGIPVKITPPTPTPMSQATSLPHPGSSLRAISAFVSFDQGPSPSAWDSAFLQEQVDNSFGSLNSYSNSFASSSSELYPFSVGPMTSQFMGSTDSQYTAPSSFSEQSQAFFEADSSQQHSLHSPLLQQEYYEPGALQGQFTGYQEQYPMLPCVEEQFPSLEAHDLSTVIESRNQDSISTAFPDYNDQQIDLRLLDNPPLIINEGHSVSDIDLGVGLHSQWLLDEAFAAPFDFSTVNLDFLIPPFDDSNTNLSTSIYNDVNVNFSSGPGFSAESGEFIDNSSSFVNVDDQSVYY